MPKNFRSKSHLLLMPGERIVFVANPHVLLAIFPVAGLALFWIISLLVLCPGLEASPFRQLCYLFSAFAFSFVTIVVYLDWHFNRLYLTSCRLVKQRGIIGKRFASIWLKNIEDVSCYYGIIGRILGFGDLEIESAGTRGNIIFKGIAQPRAMKHKIEKQISGRK